MYDYQRIIRHTMEAVEALDPVLTERAGQWDEKILGKNWRLFGNDESWRIEELPEKGKRKLKVGTMQNYLRFRWPRGVGDDMIPSNVLQDAKIRKTDSYETAKKKLEGAMKDALAATAKKADKAEGSKSADWLLRKGMGDFDENQVHYLTIEPEHAKPIKAKAKDFTITSKWGDFKVYDPDADMHSHDPTYSVIRLLAALGIIQLPDREPAAQAAAA